MDEVITEFITESHENLGQLDQDLVELEKDPHSTDRLGSVFRTFHTMKGVAGFLNFARLEALAHAAEELLSRLRDGELMLDAAIASALLAAVDAVRQMLAIVEASGNDGEVNYTALIESLARLSGRAATGGGEASVAEAMPHETIAEEKIEEEKIEEVIEPDVTETPLAAAAIAPRPTLAAKGERTEPNGAPVIADSTIRVNVHLLDKLMNLVGELVLVRNQVLQYANGLQEPTFLGASQRLNLITTELQEGIMKTRMQPIGTIWNKFPRIVRDLALACGKQVRIEMDGEETELDKTLIEAIRDPLTHVVRNAIDHGIEAPQERAAAGKPHEGRLLLRAFHESGQVIIEVAEDGAGINLDRVRAKALERGLVTAEQVARMNDSEAVKLIFLPGFSTAAKVTNLSGRGVGMDVVKTNIEKIGGTVDVQTRRGEGTTLRVKIPLTLAIIPALIVTWAIGTRFRKST